MHRNFGLRHAGRIAANDDSPPQEDWRADEAERKDAADALESCVTARALGTARRTSED